MQQSTVSLNNNNDEEQCRPTGQYSTANPQKNLSTLFQLHEDSSSSYEEYRTKLITNHDLNDRCQRNSLNTHQSIIHSESDRQSEQIAQHEPTSSSTIQLIHLRPKKKRSAAVKKRRNQKSSRRHRKNRYYYELNLRVNMSITAIKRILDEYQIDYINVNVVRSTLYPGLENAEL